jgi:hypothetical protein
MATMHFTKKEFIAELKKIIKDDEHIILTNDVNGEISVNKKKKFKQIPFIFASDAFAQPETVSDLFGINQLGQIDRKATLFSIILADDSIVSDKVKEDAKNSKKRKSKKTA